MIEGELGPDALLEVDPEPLAAASIAQIHPGILRNGREVVVKVRRPGILEQVELDLELLRSTARLAEGRSGTARLLQIEALVDELETHLRTELDLVEEASNTELIRRIVGRSEHLVVPEVMRPWVTERVLVLERMLGGKSSSVTSSRASAAVSWPGRSSAPTSGRSRSRASTTPTRTGETCS